MAIATTTPAIIPTTVPNPSGPMRLDIGSGNMIVVVSGVVIVIWLVCVSVEVIPDSQGVERGGSNEVDLDVGDVGSGGGLEKKVDLL
jgi:hypothetical protein